jgi:regulator of sigma E protease
MTVLMNFWDYVVPFLIVLTVLVFVHEMGHYLVARFNRVRVEVFSIGFGPEIFGWTDKAGTRWKVSAIPLGGYVKMFGERDMIGWGEEERSMTPKEMAVSFYHKRLPQRAAVVIAGPLANFVFAIILLGAMFFIAGSPSPLSGIGTVQKGSAAAAAGFQSGDRIIAIDGVGVRWFEELRSAVIMAPGRELKFDVERKDRLIKLSATPMQVDQGEGAKEPRIIGRLGVTPDPGHVENIRHGPLESILLSIEWTYGLAGKILGYLGGVIAGSESADQLGGPLRIAEMSGDMARGGIVSLIVFIAALSVNLGLINLFPVPMLDGGHLVFYAIEAIQGHRVSERIHEYGLRIGVVLVLMLMVFATWNDLVHFDIF